MKLIITTIIILLLFFKAVDSKAQISLEHSYPNFNAELMNVSYLANGDMVFYYVDSNNAYIYDENHVLLNILSLYQPSSQYLVSGGPIGYFATNNLFNSDNLIEIMYYTYNPNTFGLDSTFIVNQNGTVASFNGRIFKIFIKDNVFKLIARSDSSIDIYTLPGTYPCDPCSNISGLANANASSVQKLSNAYPNPANTPITISYHLPVGVNTAEILITDVQGKEVGGYRIGKEFSNILIPVDNLSSGQYFYSIITNNQIIDSGKFFISK